MNVIHALGDSHVRLFSARSDFLPMYIGPGYDNCFLTESLAARTRIKIERNLRRLPHDATVLLTFGEPDVRFQLENRFDTRRLGNSSAIAAAASRYVQTAAELAARWPQMRFAVLGCIPSARADRNDLARTYDSLLAPALQQAGIAFVEYRTSVVDPVSGLLQAEFDADGIHLSFAALGGIIRALKGIAIIERNAEETQDFSWSYNYRFPIAEDHETRFWGDKRRSAVADAVLRFLTDRHRADRGRSWRVQDCAEGYLALGLADAGFARVVGTEPDPRKLAMSLRVARFARQSTVAFEAQPSDITDFTILYPWNKARADPIAPTGEWETRVAGGGSRRYFVSDDDGQARITTDRETIQLETQ